MNYSNRKAIGMLAMLSVVFTLTNCDNKKKEVENDDTDVQEATAEVKKEAVDAVCIWEEISLREGPSAKDKFVTYVHLGEKVTYLGQTAVDSVKGKTYAKIALADGKEGWSRKDFIIPDAIPASFLQDTDIYGRPDLLTKTKSKFSAMDIVAKISEKDDWSEVTGKRKEGSWIEKGWVKTTALTTESVDIATAKFGAQAMSKENTDDRLGALEQIVANTDLSSSAFIVRIKETIDELGAALDLEGEEEIIESVDSLQ